MKAPLSWLREYVTLELPVAELAERLTLVGLEVTGVQTVGLPLPEGLRFKSDEAGPVWDREKIVVGEVLGVERHPNADRLTLATVRYGSGPAKSVVTGAPNIKVGDKGQKVVLALSGSILFDGHSAGKNLKELKPSKIRGVPSDAMVCSAFELGISDEHEGIIILEEDAEVGVPLADLMGDVVLEIDVLPNMSRCLSMIGMAREVAAITGQSLRYPSISLPADGEAIAGRVSVQIEDPKLSARYAAALIRRVAIGRSPGWMQRRLLYAGMRPISNIVDITNYVMLEWGQPLHAFDYDVLVERAGGGAPTITVRPARAGETITTLDGVSRALAPENLVIADELGPVAIAGVMGGRDTEVSEKTRDILLEAANFDFVSIRRTMRALNLPSEASMRFSRGIHPEIVKPAAERASELMHRFGGGQVCRGLVDCYPAPLAPTVVALEMREVRRILGIDLPFEDVLRTLRSLEFDVKQTGPASLLATAPPHRLDIQTGSADLIEELARIHGYDRLSATLPADRLPEQRPHRDVVVEEQVKDALVSLGLTEAITYALTEPSREAALEIPPPGYVELLNPISSERRVMRRTVLAGLLDIAVANLRHVSDVRFFEIGSVYLPRAGEKLPDEPRRLAIVLSGPRDAPFWGEGLHQERPALDFFDLKGTIEGLTAALHVEGVSYRRSTAVYLHPGRAAELVIADQAVGHFGEMHPKAAESYGMGERCVLVAELDLESILRAVPARFTYRPVPRFPAALRDIAVLVKDDIPAARVDAEIRKGGSGLLKGVRLFDLYRGENIPPGTKSLAYSLVYQADDRTLDKEVDKAHRKIEEHLKRTLGAQIRGEEEAT